MKPGMIPGIGKENKSSYSLKCRLTKNSRPGAGWKLL